jgi:hypothetical protein
MFLNKIVGTQSKNYRKKSLFLPEFRVFLPEFLVFSQLWFLLAPKSTVLICAGHNIGSANLSSRNRRPDANDGRYLTSLWAVGGSPFVRPTSFSNRDLRRNRRTRSLPPAGLSNWVYVRYPINRINAEAPKSCIFSPVEHLTMCCPKSHE